jgi:hypothetical protein
MKINGKKWTGLHRLTHTKCLDRNIFIKSREVPPKHESKKQTKHVTYTDNILITYDRTRAQHTKTLIRSVISYNALQTLKIIRHSFP